MRKSKSFPREVKEKAPGKFLAGANTDDNQVLILSTFGITLLASTENEPKVVLSKSWHEVSNGAWDGEEETLTISWVDGGTDLEVALPQSPKEIPITFKEYVDRSIVVARTKNVGGGATLRVAVRKNEKGEMFTQTTVLGARRTLESYADEATKLEHEVLELIGR